MLPSIPGYDSWKLASPYDDEMEWDENIFVECNVELEDEPTDKHKCVFHCHSDQAVHVCEFGGYVEVSCVGSDDEYTYSWECPNCGAEHEDAS